MRPFLICETEHGAHDYRSLIKRWRVVAKAAGLKLKELALAGDYPVYFVETAGAAEDPDCLYLSAGIHGDEPGASEGLLLWAEAYLATLVRRKRGAPSFLILPCLNPWGIVNNQRSDERGNDLNRLFDRQDLAPIDALRLLLEGRRFKLSVNLHEDYDGRGIYLYELARRAPDIGRDLLRVVSEIIPLDNRKRIDGKPAQDGLVLRRANIKRIPLYPEAVYIFFRHCDRCLTFETPSEFSLATRVAAQVRTLEFCVDWARRSSAPQASLPERRSLGSRGENRR